MYRIGSYLKGACALALLVCFGNGCTENPETATKQQASVSSPSPFAARAGGIERTPVREASATLSKGATAVDSAPEPRDSFSARIEADPDGGGAPLTVHFSVDGDTHVPGVRYMWDFGDRSTGRGIQVDHTFSQPGEYEVTMRAVGDGVEDSDYVTINVDEEGFDLQVDADPDIGAAPLSVNFSAVLDEELPGPFSFHWEFGDGARDASNPTNHTYRAPGAYTAVLTVSNAAGQQAQRDVEIQVDSPSGE